MILGSDESEDNASDLSGNEYVPVREELKMDSLSFLCLRVYYHYQIHLTSLTSARVVLLRQEKMRPERTR